MEATPQWRLRHGVRHLERIRKLLARLPRPPGSANEERLVRVVQDYLEHARHRPPWLLKVELATPVQDHQGIDVVVTTNAQPLFLQVKSSEAHQHIFERERGHRWRSGERMFNIGVVVVNNHRSDAEVLRATFRTLRQLLPQVEQHGIFLPPP